MGVRDQELYLCGRVCLHEILELFHTYQQLLMDDRIVIYHDVILRMGIDHELDSIIIDGKETDQLLYQYEKNS
jgi:hypothetical protein